MWPSATNTAFLLNFSSILISNIICKLTCSFLGLIFPFLVSSGVTPSRFSYAIRTFVISFAVFLVKKSVPDCLSISYASFTVLVTCIPNLCDVRQYLYFTLEIILFMCHKVSLTPQLKAESSRISFATAYLAIST